MSFILQDQEEVVDTFEPAAAPKLSSGAALGNTRCSSLAEG